MARTQSVMKSGTTGRWYFIRAPLPLRCDGSRRCVYRSLFRIKAALDGRECILTAKEGEMTLETSDGLRIGLASLDKRLPERLRLDHGAHGIAEETHRRRGGWGVSGRSDDGFLPLRFKSCMLRVKGGAMTAILTAKNNNFDYPYVGTAADASKDETGWIPAIPMWRAHMLTFSRSPPGQRDTDSDPFRQKDVVRPKDLH